jgi:serine/threonine-protein kinase
MPARLSSERWRAVLPHLDRALDLTAQERGPWLDALRAQDASLGDDLAALLERHDAIDERFLGDDPAAFAPRASLAGQAIGAYTLRAQIGQGGMGSVWTAERSDGRYQGVAAVKLLNPSLVGRDGEERFRREASILARLQHPHIAHLIDAGVSSLGQPYLVLEHVDGERIDRYCDGRRLGVEARLRLFLDVLAAVAHAHASLIVHRDLKPSNVLVTREGFVKLLDFGIAKLLEPEAAVGEGSALTREGQSVLTPEYAAPEQLTSGPVTTATDVYALGVLLYVLLTGRHPVGASTTSPAELIKAIVDTEPPRASDAVDAGAGPVADGLPDPARRRGTSAKRLRGLLRGDLDNVVAKALKKRPQERYSSAEALAEDVRRCLAHEPVTARADSFAYRTAKFVRRNRTAVALAAVAALALAGGLAGTLMQARRARAQAALAERERDFALRQLSRAEAINDLNALVLSDAAPLGKPFTAGELLARAERIVDRQPEDADHNRSLLLVAIGRQYEMQDEWTKARAVLTKAYALARDSTEPTIRAQAACALATVVGEVGEQERAEQLLAEAERVLPPEPQFALQRVFCLMRGCEVAHDRGDARLGLARAEAALRMTNQSTLPSPLLRLNVSMRLAESYRLAGRFPESAVVFQEAFGRLAALGRDDTETAGTLLNNWGLTLRASGRPLEAERLFRRAIQISSADGTEDRVSPMLLNNLARILGDLGRFPEASDYAERASARARRTGNEAALNFSLLARAAFYRERGELARAAQMIEELDARARRMWPVGHVIFAALVSERSQLAQARGDFPAALAEADRAVSLARADSQQPEFLRKALLRRSSLHLELHRLDDAWGDAQTALRLEVASLPPGTLSSHVGLAYLALGRALRAQGKLAEARAALAEATRHLEPSLGREHPATRSARELASSIP